MNISHDSVNRFLNRERYSGKDLFDESKTLIDLNGGTISADDTVLDKPYSRYMKFLGYFWSGKHHKVVQGINLISLYYTDIYGKSVPINFRIYDKTENKTKNDYFREMLQEVLDWGLKPAMVTTDAWYAGTINLKFIKNNNLGFMVGIKSNRTVSIEKGKWLQVQELDIPDEGLIVWLKELGWVKLFRTWFKDEPRHYAVYLPNEKTSDFSNLQFKIIHSQHWKIETYHRVIKQTCHLETFQVRGEYAIKNHIFASICAYVFLQKMVYDGSLENCYQLRFLLFKEVVVNFIKDFISDKHFGEPVFIGSVNA